MLETKNPPSETETTLSRPTATMSAADRFLSLLPPPMPPLDWPRCLTEFTAEKAAELATWRGYSLEFLDWLHQQQLIGIYDDKFSWPIIDSEGKVVAAYYEEEDELVTHPPNKHQPLILGGSPLDATFTLVFECPWDACAILDKLEAHSPANAGIYCAYVTRGLFRNTDLSKIPAARLIVCPKNDTCDDHSPTMGRSPIQEWLQRLERKKHTNTIFTVFTVPEYYESAHQWAVTERPSPSDVYDLVITRSKRPLFKGLISTDDILGFDVENDAKSLIGHEGRYLCEGGSWLLVGPSGIGKSTLAVGIALHAAAGKPWNGISIPKPLQVVVIQAENDRGDLNEMLRGALKASGFDAETKAVASANLNWIHENSLTGSRFCEWLEELIIGSGAELVVIDPLLSYIGDDISQQKAVSEFLRSNLQPVLTRTGAMVLFLHHTGKPRNSKSSKGTSDTDMSYAGIGSSELTNWVRAVAVLSPVPNNPKVFSFILAKRGSRAGMVDASNGEKTTCIYLKHADLGLGWTQCDLKTEGESTSRGAGRKQSLTINQVLEALGDGSQEFQKDEFVAYLASKHEVTPRTVTDKLQQLIDDKKVHISGSIPRTGGGKPIPIVRSGASIGENQNETT